MDEIVSQVLILLRGAWRYRWPAMAAAWLISIVGWIGVHLIPDSYESRTQVFVDADSLLKPLLSGLAVDRDVMSQVAMVQAVMLSRPNLESVARKTDLMLKAKTPREQEAVLDTLASKVRLERPPGTGSQSTFLVSYENDNAKTANAVIQTLLDTFMEDSLGMKRNDAGVAQRFLQSQIKEYEVKLTAAETLLATFKQQNVGLMPGSGGDYFQRLDTEMVSMQTLTQRLRQLTERRDELKRQLDGEEPTFGLMGSSDGSPIDGQIARYKAQLDQLLLQYTEKHPEVTSLRETVARLEDEKRRGARISESVAAPGATTTTNEAMVRSLDRNPVYQNLRVALSQAEADLAELRGQVAAQQSNVAGLRSRVNTIPEVEAEYTRLNRDYAINKAQYDALMQRLESARLSEQAEQNTENVKFRIIEPPSMPVAPSGPFRLLLDAAVLIGALGAGVALAILLSQIHQTFSTREVLQRVTGIPVLGSLAAADDHVAIPWHRREAVRTVGALSLLILFFVLNTLTSDALRAAVGNALG